jgi:hypothetical protein
MVWSRSAPLDKTNRSHNYTDRPVHTVVFCIGVAGFLLVSISRAWPGLFRASQSGAGYVEIPLDDREETSTHIEILPDRRAHTVGPGARTSRLLLVASICALTVRIELFRQIYKATECSISSVEVGHPSGQSHITRLTENGITDSRAPCYLRIRCITLPEAAPTRKGGPSW